MGIAERERKEKSASGLPSARPYAATVSQSGHGMPSASAQSRYRISASGIPVPQNQNLRQMAATTTVTNKATSTTAPDRRLIS